MPLTRNQAIEQLWAVWKRVTLEFDLSANRVGAGVKGGRSRPGAVFDQYISYKNASGMNLGLAVYQLNSKQPMIFEVRLRDTSMRPAKIVSTADYGEHQIGEAGVNFAAQLAGLLRFNAG
jgi:hypothetical protein